MNLLEQLNWRYATKRMTGEKVPQDKINTILEAIRLSASSNGLQPYRVVVVESEELKQKIHATACPQPQVLECSHLLVFAAWEKITEAEVDAFIQFTAAERGISPDNLQGWANSIKGLIKTRTPEENFQWLAKQAYIGLGTGITAAALEAVDATPMEGFSPAAMDEVLGLPEKGLRSVVLLAVGYRNAELDQLAGAKKVRRPKEDFFIHRG